jgi:FkbM family methyltransferase
MWSTLQRLLHRAHLARKLHRDEPELALLEALCGGGLVFDVGANEGLYVYAAQRAGAQVVAFEPHPAMARRLRTTFPGLDVRALALSDAPGQLALHVPVRRGRPVLTRSSLEVAANPDFELTRVEVPVARLDGLGLPNPTLLKVDVEGHELRVLSGARAMLESGRPRVLVEVEERHHPGQSVEVFRLLAALGYDGAFLARGSFQPIASFDPAVHQRGGTAKAVGARRDPSYVNNFLFLHRDDADVRRQLAHAGWPFPV